MAGCAVGGGGDERLGEARNNVVLTGAGEEVDVDSLKGLGVDPGSEPELQGQPGHRLRAVRLGDDHEVVPAENHVPGHKAGAGHIHLLRDVIYKLGIIYQLPLPVSRQSGQENIKHGGILA